MSYDDQKHAYIFNQENKDSMIGCRFLHALHRVEGCVEAAEYA